MMYLDSTDLVSTIYRDQRMSQKLPQKTASGRTSSQDFRLSKALIGQNTGGMMRAGNAQYANHTQSTGFSLHIGSGEDGDNMLSAVAGRKNSGMTVFEPADFDPEHPVYKVCIWDEDGNRTECMVDVTNVDPHHSDEAEMFAYSCYVAKSGAYPEAADLFLRTRGYFHEAMADMEEWSEFGTDTVDSAERHSSQRHFALRNVKEDWTKLAASIMQMQYEGGNLKGYLEYKKFVDFFE